MDPRFPLEYVVNGCHQGQMRTVHPGVSVDHKDTCHLVYYFLVHVLRERPDVLGCFKAAVSSLWSSCALEVDGDQVPLDAVVCGNEKGVVVGMTVYSVRSENGKVVGTGRVEVVFDIRDIPRAVNGMLALCGAGELERIGLRYDEIFDFVVAKDRPEVCDRVNVVLAGTEGGDCITKVREITKYCRKEKLIQYNQEQVVYQKEGIDTGRFRARSDSSDDA